MELEPLITSRANPRFKSLRALVAAAGGKRSHTFFLGRKLIEAWEQSGSRRFHPELWLRLEGAAPDPLEARLGLETLILGETLMRDLAEAGSAPDHALLVSLGPEPTGPLPGRVIVPWGIQDPGNLGAILRSAAAFGFQEALLGPGCADPFAPKALRGSMGAAFLMPLRRRETLTSGQIADGAAWLALDGGADALSLEEAPLAGPLRILVGNEGHGFQGAALPPGIARVAIPTTGVESLNAAVAAGIACFETDRRARIAGLPS